MALPTRPNSAPPPNPRKSALPSIEVNAPNESADSLELPALELPSLELPEPSLELPEIDEAPNAEEEFELPEFLLETSDEIDAYIAEKEDNEDDDFFFEDANDADSTSGITPIIAPEPEVEEEDDDWGDLNWDNIELGDAEDFNKTDDLAEELEPEEEPLVDDDEAMSEFDKLMNEIEAEADLREDEDKEGSDDPELDELLSGIDNDSEDELQKFPDVDENDEKAVDEEADNSEEETIDLDSLLNEESEDELDLEDGEALAPLSKKKGKKKRKAKEPFLARGGKGVIGALSRLPVIGKLFAPLAKVASFIMLLIMLLPLLAIPLIVHAIAGGSIPSVGDVTLPDNGSASIANVNFDSNSKLITAEVMNTGDVIADVTPEFTVWSYSPSLSPASWFSYKEIGKCEGTSVVVGIDATEIIEASCELESISGITPKASGKLIF